jgi:hypothetical protein
MTTKAQQRANEKAEAIRILREDYKIAPGTRLATVLRHCSRSGMLRVISVLAPTTDGDITDISPIVARATGSTFDRDRWGIKMGGCGMDMGHAIVYNLGHAMFPNGFGCIGPKCPSNDHSNGDRDYTPHPGCGTPDARGHRDHWHASGGYALRQYWI